MTRCPQFQVRAGTLPGDLGCSVPPSGSNSLRVTAELGGVSGLLPPARGQGTSGQRTCEAGGCPDAGSRWDGPADSSHFSPTLSPALPRVSVLPPDFGAGPILLEASGPSLSPHPSSPHPVVPPTPQLPVSPVCGVRMCPSARRYLTLPRGRLVLPRALSPARSPRSYSWESAIFSLSTWLLYSTLSHPQPLQK